MDIKHPSLRSRSVALGANALCWQSFQFLLGSLPLTVTAYALKQDFWKGSERRKLLRNSRVRVCEINFHKDPQLQHSDCCLCNNKKQTKKAHNILMTASLRENYATCSPHLLLSPCIRLCKNITLHLSLSLNFTLQMFAWNQRAWLVMCCAASETCTVVLWGTHTILFYELRVD